MKRLRVDARDGDGILGKEQITLDKASVGDQVDFTIVETARGEYLTQLKKVQSVPAPR